MGKVIKIDSDGDIHVQFNGQKWCYNAACLVPAPGQSIDTLGIALGGGDSDSDDDGNSSII